MDFSYNQLNNIPVRIFDDLDDIEIINLSKNNLNTIDFNVFSKRENLKAINLSSNLIDSIIPFSNFVSCNFYNMKSLSLQSNQLKNTEFDTFSDLPALEILILNDNCLSKIEKYTFARLRTLKILHLNKNRIQSIESSSFDDLESLEMLALHDNYLSKESVDENAFFKLKSLKTIRLSKFFNF